MNVAQEHVLEHALGELFGAQRTDLPQRVLERLRSEGVRRSVSLPSARSSRIGHHGIPVGLAAAAVLFLIAWMMGTGSTAKRSGALASSEIGLEVLRPGEATPRLAREFLAGETLINGPEQERRLTVAGSGEVLLGRCAMLALHRDRSGLTLEPLMGSTTLEVTGPEPLQLRTDLGTLVLEAPARLRVELQIDGYALGSPERFRHLAKEIHMKAALPLALTVVTLLEGEALFESAGATRELVAGQPVVQEREPRVSVEDVERRLMDEVGTWDLTITSILPDGTPADPVPGIEVCRAGPGEKWLLTELTVLRDTRDISIHTVVGYNPRKQAYNGSLIDSFGGEMGLLRGLPERGLHERTLEMYSGQGTPGFESRWFMRWESPDRRVTEITRLDDGEWVLIREIVHERRKAEER